MDQHTCPTCHQPVQENNFFCANCGAKLKQPGQPTTIGAQIKVYAISILLPPLGLWPGVKYLMDKDVKAKKIGGIAVFLTIVSTCISIVFAVQISKNINDQVQKEMSKYNSFY